MARAWPEIENGDPLMGRVTAMGCAATALVAACLAVETDAWLVPRLGCWHSPLRGMRGSPRAWSWQLLHRDARCFGKSRSRDLAVPRQGALMPLDMRLYALIDPEHSGGHDVVELARQVAQGGATMVQLRDKRSTTRAMVERAGRIKAVLAPLQLPFVDK